MEALQRTPLESQRMLNQQHQVVEDIRQREQPIRPEFHNTKSCTLDSLGAKWSTQSTCHNGPYSVHGIAMASNKEFHDSFMKE